MPPDQVDEVVLGCILQAGLGMNPARQATIKAGLPESMPALTVNKVCGSGLKAVMMAAQADPVPATPRSSSPAAPRA